MKKRNEPIHMESKIEISLKLLPFGSISFEIPPAEPPQLEKKPEMPVYVEPLRTNIETVEIRYEGGHTYIVPKTTQAPCFHVQRI